MNINCTRWAIAAVMIFALAACGGGGGDTDTSSSGGNNNGGGGGGTDNSSSPGLVTNVDPASYSGDYATEKVAVFSLLNAYRSQCGFGMLAQNSLLDQAAQSHAKYAAQYDEGHFENPERSGFTGVAPADRVSATGYLWSSVDEVLVAQAWGFFLNGSLNNGHALLSISQLSATANLKSLLSAPYHIVGALSLNREIGLGIANQALPGPDYNFKQLNINFGTAKTDSKQSISTDSISTFPCHGVTGLNPVFAGEMPDPFPEINRDVSPYGQPVYVMTAAGSTVGLDGARSTITARGGAAVPTRLLSQSNDPNARLTSNQVFLVPTTRLADNTAYDVVLHGTLSTLISQNNPTGSWTRSFTFYTGKFRGE